MKCSKTVIYPFCTSHTYNQKKPEDKKQVVEQLYKTLEKSTLSRPYRRSTYKIINQIIENFHYFKNEYSLFENNISVELQQIIIILAASYNSDTIIFKHKFIETLDVINNNLPDRCMELKKIIDKIKSNDNLEYILKQGIENFNAITKKNIILDCSCINKLKDDDYVIQLKQEGHSEEEIFINYPQYRKNDHDITCDDIGIQYLKGIHIGGYLTRQRIRSRELTVIGALDKRQTILDKIKAIVLNNPNLTDNQKTALLNKTVCKYVVDEVIEINQAKDLSIDAIYALTTPGVQKYIDNGMLLFNQAIELNTHEVFNLNIPIIQKYIDNGAISIRRAKSLSLEEISSLSDPVNQKYIDNHILKISHYFNKNNLEQAI